MGTNYIAPIWRMPRNANKDKLSNYSIDFSSTDYINFNSFPDIAENNCYSFSFWFKTTSTSNIQVICDDAQTNLFELRTRFSSIQVIDAIAGRVSTTQQLQANVAAVTNDVRDGDWHHIAFIANTQTHDPTISNDYVANLYLDGYRAAQVAFGSPSTLAGVMASTLRLNNSFTGQVSQFCFFNRVLTDGGVNQYELAGGEVAQLYNLTNPMIFSAPPVVYTPLGDNSNPNAPGSFPNISVGADSVFDFNIDKYINVADSDSLSFGDGSTDSAFSVSTWVNFDDVTNSSLFSKSEASGQREYSAHINSEKIYFGLYSELGNNYIYRYYDTALTSFQGSWVHFVFTYDGSKSVDGLKIYLNNSKVDDQSITSGTYVAMNNGTAPFRIGRSFNNRHLNGEMSNLQVWDTELLPSQIETLYNNGQPLMTGTQPQEANLKAWYKLNQSANYNQGVSGIAFEVDQIGTPDVSGGGDHAFVNPALSPLSFECQDLNSVGTGSPNYDLAFPVNNGVRWKSLKVNGRYNNLYLSANVSLQNGSTSFGFAGARLIYVIDSGAEVTWQDISVNPSDPNSLVAFNPTVGSLSCENSIQIFIDCGTANYSAARVRIDNVTIKEGGASGTNIYNEDFGNQSGAGWNGTYTAATSTTYVDPSWQIPDNRSAYPQSFDFDSGHISLPSTNLSITGALTISAWVKTTSSTYQSVLIKGNSVSAADYYFRIQDTGLIRLRFGNTNYGIGTTSVKDGNWHHICVVYVPSTSVTYYVDGEQDSQTTSSIPAAITNSYTNVGIGEIQQFIGQISNVQVFNTALPATGTDSVKTLYNNGVPLTTAIATDNLKAWYKLDNTEYFNNEGKWIVDNDAITLFYNNALNFTNQSGGSGNSIEIFSGTPASLPSNLSFGASDSFSFSTWLWSETKETSNKMAFVMRGSGGSDPYNRLDCYYLPGNNSVRLTMSLRADNNATATVSTTASVPGHPESGAWFNVVVVVDRTAQTLQMFVNAEGTGAASISSLDGFLDLTDITIGNDPYTGGRNYYEGRQSNFAIFNTALTQNQIETLYNNGTPEEDISHSPVSWWKLNNLTTGLVDSAGGGNDATAASWMTAVESSVNANIGVSSGMTEQNLVNNNVSVLNGESSGMNSTNLVQSNLTRKVPFSNYSTKFDGIDYYTDTGGGFLNGATTASISVWMNMATLTSGQQSPAVSNWGTAPQRQYLIRHVNSGTDGFQFYIYGPSRDGVVDFVLAETQNSIPASANTWYNIVGTWDGSEIKIYVNGVLGGSETAISGSLSSSTDPNWIGRYSTTYMNGNISNAAFWTDTVLSEDDILNIYNNGITQDLSNFRIQPTNWFPLGESYTYYNGSVMVARDVIGGGEVDGVNIVQSDIAGNAPGSDANGEGNNLAIADLKGNMYNSDKNAYSINMADYADSVTNPANSGRSTDTP